MTKTQLKSMVEQVMVEQLQLVFEAIKIQTRKIIKQQLQKTVQISQGSNGNIKKMLNGLPQHQKIATPSYANVQQSSNSIPQYSRGGGSVINTGNGGKFSISDIIYSLV